MCGLSPYLGWQSITIYSLPLQGLYIGKDLLSTSITSSESFLAHRCRSFKRPFRLREFTLGRKFSEREMSEDYCVDILGRALQRCSATLQKVELRLRQLQFQDPLDGVHSPNPSILSIEHSTTTKLSSAVVRFLITRRSSNSVFMAAQHWKFSPLSYFPSPSLRLIRPGLLPHVACTTSGAHNPGKGTRGH